MEVHALRKRGWSISAIARHTGFDRKTVRKYVNGDGEPGVRARSGRTKFPPLRQTAHTYLTAAEVAALTLACGSQGDVVALLAHTGLRFGELTGLNVEDVDLKARRIRVRRSITQVGGKLVRGNPKSKAGRRSVPFPQRLLPILTTRLAARE